MLQKSWPLFSGAEYKNRDSILGEVEKSSFNCFAKRWANALKTLGSTLERVGEFCSVEGAGCDQLVDSSWIDWHQDEVQASSTSWFQPVWGLCSCGQQFSPGGVCFL